MPSEIKVATARFTLPSTTEGVGDINHTIASLGWTPKAAMFCAYPAYSGSNPTTDAMMSVGFGVSGSERWSAHIVNETNEGNVVAGREHSNSHVVVARSRKQAGGLRIDGDMDDDTPFIADGCRIHWSTVSGTSVRRYFFITFFGGADLQAKVVSQALGTQDTAVDINTIGFEPDLVFASSISNGTASSLTGEDDTFENHMVLNFGVCGNIAGTPQYGMCHSDEHNNGVANPTNWIWSDGVAGQVFDGVETWRCALSGFDSSGFTATAKEGNSSSDYVGFLCLGTGDRKVWVGGVDIPTSGNIEQRGLGFKPQAYGLVGTGLTAYDTASTSAGAGSACIGATDGTREGVGNIAIEDAETVTDTQTEARDDAVLSCEDDDGAATFFRGNHSAMHTDGFDVAMTVHDTTVRKGFGWAIEEEAAGGTAVGIATETDTALAVSATKTRALGQVTETGTALAITAVKTRAVGLVTETDAALSLSSVKARAVGLATESDTALSISSSASTEIGLATETDAALAMTRQKARQLGIATETDTALDIAQAGQTLVGIATETDTALSMTARKTRQAGIASESDAALAVVARKAREMGLATSTNTALALSRQKTLAIGIGSETSTALPISSGGGATTGGIVDIKIIGEPAIGVQLIGETAD